MRGISKAVGRLVLAESSRDEVMHLLSGCAWPPAQLNRLGQPQAVCGSKAASLGKHVSLSSPLTLRGPAAPLPPLSLAGKSALPKIIPNSKDPFKSYLCHIWEDLQ